MFRNAQVGDRVWDFVLGWGTITSIKEKSDFPLTLMFDYKEDYYYIYTLEGKNIVRIYTLDYFGMKLNLKFLKNLSI